jgi:hypothetical protein
VIQVTPAEGSAAGLAAAIGVAEHLQSGGFCAALVNDEACRWCLTVDARAGGPRYLLEDRRARTVREASSIDQIMAAMKRA